MEVVKNPGIVLCLCALLLHLFCRHVWADANPVCEVESNLFTKYQVVCSGGNPKAGAPPSAFRNERQADFRGRIKSITKADVKREKKEWLGSILVEATGGRDTPFEKASVDISNETEIFKQVANEMKPAKLSDLKVGLMVDVYLTGPVAYSYPVQARAKMIIIIQSNQ
jgi:hypothetical protein